MKRHIYRVISVSVEGPHTLRLKFDDRTVQTVDLSPILCGQIFAPLRDLALFSQVRIDPEVGTIVWPNGADMDPGILHDWPERAEAMADMAKRWARSEETKTAHPARKRLQVAEDKPKYGAAKGRRRRHLDGETAP
jgi:hypothetical protein